MRFTVAAVLLLGFTAAAVAADVGEIKIMRGAAHLERGKQKLPVSVGMPVQENDKVITGDDGTVGITFADNSLLSVGPNSVFHEIKSSLRPGGRTPPTCSVFFAEPGAATDIGGAGVGSTSVVVPQLPVSKTTSMSGCA